MTIHSKQVPLELSPQGLLAILREHITSSTSRTALPMPNEIIQQCTD